MYTVWFISDVHGCAQEFCGSLQECIDYCQSQVEDLTAQEGFQIIDMNGQVIEEF